jgi:hypothetical protein
MICPGCNSPDVRVSQQVHWSDVFQRLLGCQAYRCRKCRRRFYAPAFSGLTPSTVGQPGSIHTSALIASTRNKRRLIRRLIAIVIFTVMFVIFWFYLRYLTTDRTPPDSSEMIWPLSSIPLGQHEGKSSSATNQDVSRRCLSDMRTIYSVPSIANIQPDTAGRGKG